MSKDGISPSGEPRDESPPPVESKLDLATKLEQWLETEGYSVEYAAANVFEKHNIRAIQGHYVSDPLTQKRREIDVNAWIVKGWKHGWLRLDWIVECKKSPEPWVFFATHRANRSSSACIAQAVASELGHCGLWCAAGHPELTALRTFASPPRPSFSGRRAWSRDNDVVYNTLSSTASATLSVAKELDQNELQNEGTVPKWAGIAFPVVVLDGLLFEATPNDTGALGVEPVDAVRVHWRGSQEHFGDVTIDVVRLAALDAFVAERVKDAEVIARVLGSVLPRFLPQQHYAIDPRY